MLSERGGLVIRRVVQWEHPLECLGDEHQRVALARRVFGQNTFAHFGFAHLGDALGQRQVGDLPVAREHHERIARQFEPHHQADGSREDLRCDVTARRIRLLHHVEAVDEERVARVADRQGERHGQTNILCDVEHRLQRGPVVTGDEVGHELDQAAAGVLDTPRDRLDLGVPCIETRYRMAAFALVQCQPGRCKTECTDLNGLLGEFAHKRQVLVSGCFAVDAAPAHHVDAQRRVRKECRDVDIALSCLQRIEELGEGLPRPWQPVDHDDSWDVLHTCHQVDEGFVVVRPARCEAHTAVAHHRGGHTVRRRRRQPVGPDRLPVVVRMQVDEPRCHEQPGRVDLPVP